MPGEPMTLSQAQTLLADLSARLARRERELGAAARIGQMLFQGCTLDEKVEHALQTALELVNAEAGSVLLAVPETRQLVFKHSIGVHPVPLGVTMPWDQGIAGTVFESGKLEIVRDAKQDPRHFPGIDLLTELCSRDMIVLPLKQREGRGIGVLTVLNKRDGRLTEEDVGVLSIISSFTALAIEEARLVQEAKLAEVVRLLGDIGHDIRNMLMPVVCAGGLLKAEFEELYPCLPADQAEKAKASRALCHEVIDMLQRNTQCIQDRVKEIADCVKGLSTPPKFAPCRIAEVVEDVLKVLAVLAQERGVRLQTEGLETLPALLADERRLYNAFYNLVNNAIPEVPAGGAVTIRGTAEPDAIRLTVADTGRGMPREVCESLFTTRAISRKAGGTGLGTKIVKDVVDAHGGQITVESGEGVGTTFSIRLPLRPPGSDR
jgi:signal transduction histidine kinase